MPRTTFILLPILIFVACFPSPRPYEGPTPEALEPDLFVGCYQATFYEKNEWRPDNGWRLRLYADTAASNKPGGGRGLPARRATASIQDRDDPYWRIIPRGVQLHIGDTLHGVYFDFTPTAEGLAGRAFYYSDTARGFGTERVSARKVECTGEWDSLQ
jgi:hypothetical protein